MHPFVFHGATLHALPSGALFWPARRLLCVSDLHFGKSERLARRGGGLLPPYDTRDTLARLDGDLERTQAQTVICLGDSFDDAATSGALAEEDRLWIVRMVAGRRWIWIEGNHDPGPPDVPGTHLAELTEGPLTFRHIAEPVARAELSGHYHPKLRLAGQPHRAFLVDADRVILPAYGAYTGGLWSHDPALLALMRPEALALACTARAVHPMPMPRSERLSSTKAR